MINVKVTGIDGNKVQISDGKEQIVITREQLNNSINSGKVQVIALKVECIAKKRDGNNIIVAYTVVDSAGNKMNVTPIQLKKAIYNYSVICTNLKLASDGRLIDKKSSESIYKKDESITDNTKINWITDENIRLAKGCILEAHLRRLKVRYTNIDICDKAIRLYSNGVGDMEDDDGMTIYILKNSKQDEFYMFLDGMFQASLYTNTALFKRFAYFEELCKYLRNIDRHIINMYR